MRAQVPRRRASVFPFYEIVKSRLTNPALFLINNDANLTGFRIIKKTFYSFPYSCSCCRSYCCLCSSAYSNSHASRDNSNSSRNSTRQSGWKCDGGGCRSASYCDGLLVLPVGLSPFFSQSDVIAYRKLLREAHCRCSFY